MNKKPDQENKQRFGFRALLAAIALLALMSATVALSREKLVQDTPELPNTPEQQEGYDQGKDVGAKPPLGADILFDGTRHSLETHWNMWPDEEMGITWSLMPDPTSKETVLMSNGGKRWATHDLVTKKKYQDFEGHVEFIMMGKRGDKIAQGYSNSGVYLQNRYEIQIESPKGKNVKDPYRWKIGLHGIGAFCMEHVPSRNAWRPNGQWHAFHFQFRAARWQGEQCIEPARATVWWNGIKIHDQVRLTHSNGGVQIRPSLEGLKLQEHGQDVRFKNIWILE